MKLSEGGGKCAPGLNPFKEECWSGVAPCTSECKSAFRKVNGIGGPAPKPRNC